VGPIKTGRVSRGAEEWVKRVVAEDSVDCIQRDAERAVAAAQIPFDPSDEIVGCRLHDRARVAPQ
jgi:hypothetical protein